jgi:hypothetical protein
MATEEQVWREEDGDQPGTERPDEQAPYGLVPDGEGQGGEYEGPDPERAESPRIADEDQGV